MKTYKGICTPNNMDWEIYVDNKKLDPRLDLFNHSPDGFSWGYSGSGCAQSALAILADCTGNDELAVKYHQDFKAAVISRLAQNEGWEMTEFDVKERLTRILIKEWESNTMFLSSIHQMKEFESFKYLVSLSSDIIPFLLRIIGRNPMVSIILYEIVDDGPTIPEEQRGRVQYITEAWINWGFKRNLI